jgi:hypothetical protein
MGGHDGSCLGSAVDSSREGLALLRHGHSSPPGTALRRDRPRFTALLGRHSRVLIEPFPTRPSMPATPPAPDSLYHLAASSVHPFG